MVGVVGVGRMSGPGRRVAVGRGRVARVIHSWASGRVGVAGGVCAYEAAWEAVTEATPMDHTKGRQGRFRLVCVCVCVCARTRADQQ